MRRFIAVAIVAALFVAVPLTHADANKRTKFRVPTCITGKSKSSGVVVDLPFSVASRLSKQQVGCISFGGVKGDPKACVCKKGKPKPKK